MMLICYSILFAVFYIGGIASAAEVHTVEIDWWNTGYPVTAATDIDALQVIEYDWSSGELEVIDWGFFNVDFVYGTFDETLLFQLVSLMMGV